MRVVVFHDYYGCDTGCCGHTVELGNEKRFLFDHPGIYDPRTRVFTKEEPLEFAKRLIREAFDEEHVADLDWDNCLIVTDC